MLTFAPLLWIAVLGVDAASHQSLSKESSTQCPLLPTARVRTRRLIIFESFAKSDGQRNDDIQSEVADFHRDYFDSDDDQTTNEHLKHSLLELTEIIEGMMRTPVIPCESAESLIVFQSLARMLSNRYPKQSDPLSSWRWQRYLRESVRNLKCSVKDLCHEHRNFKCDFKCDHKGHLTMIRLYGMVSRYDHLNLLMIPNPVEKIKIERTRIQTISNWKDLRGKSLKEVNIYGSESLNVKLNLDGLQGPLDHLPLKYLSVEIRSVAEYFGIQSLFPPENITLPRIARWVRNSTLLTLRIEARDRKRRSICFQRDGTWRHVQAPWTPVQIGEQ